MTRLLDSRTGGGVQHGEAAHGEGTSLGGSAVGEGHGAPGTVTCNVLKHG